ARAPDPERARRGLRRGPVARAAPARTPRRALRRRGFERLRGGALRAHARHPARHAWRAGTSRARGGGRPGGVLRRAPLRGPRRGGRAGRAGGLGAVEGLVGGLAFLGLFAKEDATIGDDVGFQPRPAATYRRLLRAAGFVPLGLHCYAGRALAPELVAFERA